MKHHVNVIVTGSAAAMPRGQVHVCTVLVVFLIAAVFLPGRALGQAEKFYWLTGNAFPYKIVEADALELKYEEIKGSSTVRRTVDRDNVIIAFNGNGMYLIIEDLPEHPEDARNTLKKFYSAPGPGTDILIKASPLTVIPATIRTEDEAVNYLTESGQPASIRKSELIAIIYKNGSHQLMKDPVEAKGPLQSVLGQVSRIKPKTPVAQASPKTETPGIRTTAPTSQTPPALKGGRPVLTESEQLVYRKQALKKVEQFADYLQVIANRDFSMAERDVAINNALKLFMPGTEIQVWSKSRKTISKQSIETYLKRLKMLPYGNVEIKWSNIEFVQELTQTSDGSYEGRIIGSQTFTGLNAKSNAVLYSDVTKKDVKVKLRSFEKETDGELRIDWSLLLGNIGVVEN